MHSLCALGLDALMDGEGYGAWRGCALIAICERPLWEGMPQAALRELSLCNGHGWEGAGMAAALINAQVREGRLGSLMGDLVSPAGDEKETDIFREAQDWFMRTEEGRGEMSDAMLSYIRDFVDEAVDSAVEEAIEETRQETNMELAMRLRDDGIYTDSDIERLTGIDIGSLS